MKPGFTPNPVINSEGLTNLISHIAKTDSRLYDALIKGTLNTERAYQLIKNHDDRLINLEKSKKVCRLSRLADLGPISSGLVTAIPYTNELYDNDDMHDPITNAERITINTPGYYDVVAQTQWDDAESAAGIVVTSIDLNVLGTSIGQVSQPGSLLTVIQQATSTYKFNQGDFIIHRVFQDSGGNRTVRFDIGTYFWAHMVERIWNPEDIPNRMVE